MQYFDVFNGDADGLIARHQYRLSFPLPPERVKLITGCKREIALLSRVDAGADADISVFDLSYDQNAAAVRGLLDRGASIRYFDHHRASQLRPAPQFEAHIDTSPATCTSLIVDRYLNAAHHTWAIAAAFGDNLTIIAQTLALNAGLSGAKSAALRDLGECLNYNAYGASVTDLFFAPDEIARRMRKFADPFEFMVREDIVARLRSGLAADMRCAESIGAMHASDSIAIYILPNAAWARRVSGTFANSLASSHPHRAHAVLTGRSDEAYTVSIRAPLDHPHSADIVATHFPGGGGRAGAAGIDTLARDKLPALADLLKRTYVYAP